MDQQVMIVRFHSDCIGGIMVSVLASSAVDCGFESRSDQTIKFVFVASPLNMQH